MYTHGLTFDKHKHNDKHNSNVYNDNGKNTIFSFENTQFNLSKFKTKSTTYPKIQEVSSLNLFKCIFFLKNIISESESIDVFSCNKNITGVIKQQLYKRLIIPFNIIVLSLIGSFLLIKSKDEFGYLNFKIIIFSFGFLMLIVSEITTKFMEKSTNLQSLYLIILPIILFMISYFYLYKKLN